MNASPQIIELARASRDCAIQMMENAAYIWKELPNVSMPVTILEGIKSMCEDWIGTKHDLISEDFLNYLKCLIRRTRYRKKSRVSASPFKEYSPKPSHLSAKWWKHSTKLTKPVLPTGQLPCS